ncbi:MAG TPA: hypothetical protein VIH72_06315 [Candidatus Acidoferrales bacterium]
MKLAARVLLLTIVLSVASPLGFSQAAKDQTSEKNLYAVALFASLRQMDKEWSQYADSSQGKIREDYHHMVVEEDDTTYRLPTSEGDYNVEYLNDGKLRARRKFLGKDFPSLKVFPARNDGADLKIQVSVYWIGFKKGMLGFGLSDWSVVTFRYDCEKKEFVVADVKLGGI